MTSADINKVIGRYQAVMAVGFEALAAADSAEELLLCRQKLLSLSVALESAIFHITGKAGWAAPSESQINDFLGYLMGGSQEHTH